MKNIKISAVSVAFFLLVFILSSGNTKEQTRAEKLKEAAKGLPPSTQVLVDTIIKQDAMFCLRAEYVKKVSK